MSSYPEKPSIARRREIATAVLVAFAGDPSTSGATADKMGRLAVAWTDALLAELAKQETIDARE